MSIKKSKLIDVAEGLARKLYGLSPNYDVTTYSAKQNAFDLTMSNGLITLKVTFPVSLLEDNAELESVGSLEDNTNVDEGEQDNGKEQEQKQEQKESEETKEGREKEPKGKTSKRRKLSKSKK